MSNFSLHCCILAASSCGVKLGVGVEAVVEEEGVLLVFPGELVAASSSSLCSAIFTSSPSLLMVKMLLLLLFLLLLLLLLFPLEAR